MGTKALNGVETIIFVVDVDAETSIEAPKGTSRMDLVKHCIAAFVQSKRKVNGRHRYGLAALKDKAQWESHGVNSSTEMLLSALKAVQPSSSSFPTCDLGSLFPLVQQVQLQEQQQGADASTVRIVLFYCRSSAVPVWLTHVTQGVAVDLVYLHSRPEPGVNRPQEVFTFLEDNIELMARLGGQSAYILECWAGNVKKVLCCTMALMSPLAQRVPQQQLHLMPQELTPPPQPTMPAAAAASRSPPFEASTAPPSSSSTTAAATVRTSTSGLAGVAGLDSPHAGPAGRGEGTAASASEAGTSSAGGGGGGAAAAANAAAVAGDHGGSQPQSRSASPGTSRGLKGVVKGGFSAVSSVFRSSKDASVNHHKDSSSPPAAPSGASPRVAPPGIAGAPQPLSSQLPVSAGLAHLQLNADLKP